MNRHFLAQAPPVQVIREDSAPNQTKPVPFDYVVTLELTGVRNNFVDKVINISVEGYFIATAISYSLVAEPLKFGPVETDDSVVVEAPPLKPRTGPRASLRVDDSSATSRKGFLKVFGEPNAEVQLLTFGTFKDPRVRGTIPPTGILEIEKPIFEEKRASRGEGSLLISDVTNNSSNAITVRRIPVIVNGSANWHVTPQFGPALPAVNKNMFDIVGTGKVEIQVFRFTDPAAASPFQREEISIPSTGRAEAVLKDPLKVGETIILHSLDSHLSSVIQLPDKVIDLKLAAIPAKHLRRGFRISPRIMDRLENEVPIPPEELEKPFESCCAKDLSFLYTIIDKGSGRELQSEPIHNIAGLGIANGDRPFRVFPKPIVFEPRSVIQFHVQEISGGPGTLYFVLQGYKMLGTGGVRLEG